MTKEEFDILYQKLPLKGRRTMICKATGLNHFQVQSVLDGYTTDLEKIEKVCTAVKRLAIKVEKSRKQLPSFRTKKRVA